MADFKKTSGSSAGEIRISKQRKREKEVNERAGKSSFFFLSCVSSCT